MKRFAGDKSQRKSAVGAAPAPATKSSLKASGKEKLAALAIGIWIAISLLKFGNPVIFERMIAAPANVAEFVFTPWPIGWGYLLLGIAVLCSLSVLRPGFRKEQWPIILFGVWLFWQFLSSTRTVDRELTRLTLGHFVSCGVALLMGWWVLSRVRLGGWFWTPILVTFFYALFSGFDQHHGGLESTRKAFFEQANWELYPKEYIQKIQSERIFSTFVYPNAFAGAMILLLPVSLWQAWALTERWPRVARGVLMGLFGYLGLGCLYWTGSKGGWLIALGMVAVAVLHLNFSRKIKLLIVTLGIVLGLSAFLVRFSGYFQRGATSVGARFTYWSAAVQTARSNPVFGTGPGTFSIPYRQIKPADAEMAKLAHNDYLEQASDSGIVGGLTFAGFIVISMAQLYRRSWSKGWGGFLVWLGLLGWAAQALIEFSLYIPGIAWPVFLFFGWLWSLEEDKAIQNNI